MIARLYLVDDETPARERMKMLLGDIAGRFPHRVVGEASQATLAIEGIAASLPDIVLLDVQMPGMSGLELAARLRDGAARAPAVIFVSAFEDYAVRAFDVQALDYLVKPVRAERLATALERAWALHCAAATAHAVDGDRADAETSASDRPGVAGGSPATMAQTKPGRGAGTLAGTGSGDRAATSAAQAAATNAVARRGHFSVHERDRLLLVPVTDVIYLKAELKYVTLRTLAREYLIEESLSSIEEEFADLFVRVHRNALVARGAIAGVERGSGHGNGALREDAPAPGASQPEAETERSQEPWQVVLRGVQEQLPISRRQWPVVKALVR
jgi:two-component system response regulator AlgR